MKKVLLLGGTHYQINSIKACNRLGHYSITCDYNPKNPGHKYANEYHEVSALDKEGVLKLAKKLKIDGIVCYAADTAAVTAAYVAEKMCLPGQPLKSIEILTNKDLFRKFLFDNGFKTPKAKGYDNINEAIKDFDNFNKPVMVRPVDSAGSKGVSKVETKDTLEEKIKYVLTFSRNNRFIIEEYVEKNGYQIAGDGFSVNSKLVFRCFANEHFNDNSIVPIGESFPYKPISKYTCEKVDNETSKLLNLLNMRTGAYNFDVRINDNDEVILMELGPRNGGNLIAEVIKYATGVDTAEYTIKASLGEDCSDLKMVDTEGYYSCFMLHSKNSGILKSVIISEELSKNIVELDILSNIGDKVESFDNSGGTIGTTILKFDSMDEMLYKMDNMDRYIKVLAE